MNNMEQSKHSHICEMALRIKTCHRDVSECNNFSENGECLLPKINGICKNLECHLTAELDNYKLALEDSKGEIEKLKQVNNKFRTLLLYPATAQEFLKEGKMTFAGIRNIITMQKQSLDSCEIDTVLFLVQYHQEFAEAYSEYAYAKNGKIQIKAEVIERRKEENKKFTQVVEQEEKAKTPFEKTVQTYIKKGMPRPAAEAFVKAMGLLP